jgi:hypothetical protein
MRDIHVEDGFRLLFPGRDETFNEGVEVGILVVLMDQHRRDITRLIASTSVEQVRSIAAALGYRLLEGSCESGFTEVTLRFGRARPALTLVHSEEREARESVLSQERARRTKARRAVLAYSAAGT